MSRLLAKFGPAFLIAALTSACTDETLAPGRTGETGELGGPATANGSPRNDQAIRQIVNTFDQAWTAGDYVTYAAQYAGAEWIGPDGTIDTDPASITKTYEVVLTQVLPGTTRHSIIRHITFLTGTIAVLDIDVRVTGPIPGFIVPWQPGIVRALEKNVLLKRGGEWRIVQHQQLLVAPGVP
jgi:hypothetical protein